MTWQRRRGQDFTLYPIGKLHDHRGNTVKVADMERPISGRAWTYPQNGSRAEVPGQVHINVTRIGVDADLSGFAPEELFVNAVDVWSVVHFQGKAWDVVSPPAYHYGTRTVRHWSFDIRERP